MKTLSLLITLLLATTATATPIPFEGSALSWASGERYPYTYAGTFDPVISKAYFSHLELYDHAGENVIWGMDDQTISDMARVHSPITVTDRLGIEYNATGYYVIGIPTGIKVILKLPIQSTLGWGPGTVTFQDTLVPSPLGDVNIDGFVDGTDLLWYQRATWAQLVPARLPAWQSQYGTDGLQASVAAVPEPSTLWLLVGGLLGLRWRV